MIDVVGAWWFTGICIVITLVVAILLGEIFNKEDE